jgi:hypothetical protein
MVSGEGDTTVMMSKSDCYGVTRQSYTIQAERKVFEVLRVQRVLACVSVY